MIMPSSVNIYEINSENTERYLLGEISNPKDKSLIICIGLNPSTATDEIPDTTIKRIKERARRLGYPNWCMVNLYPTRFTYPHDLCGSIDEQAHKRNLKNLLLLFNKHQDFNINVWAAWGDNIEIRDYLIKCLKDISSVIPTSAKWQSIGLLTNRGNPRHPSRLAYALELQDFDLGKYISSFD